MSQRLRNVLEATARRCYNVWEASWNLPQEDAKTLSGTSWTLHQEHATTYQGHLGSYIKKMLQRIRKYQEHLGPYLKKMLQCIRNILDLTSRRCYNVWGTSWTLHQEDATAYQEHLRSYIKKMLQRIMMLHHALTAMTRCFPWEWSQLRGLCHEEIVPGIGGSSG